MSTNGIVWDVCECGTKGFKQERDATAYMLNKRRLTEPVDMVKCRIGSCFHVFDPTIRDKKTYVKFLEDTARSATQSRPHCQPPKPLTQRLPLGGAITSVAAPPAAAPPPAPPSKPACAKVKYGSEAMAVFALENVPENHGELRAYECSTCKQWHLTSKEYDPSQIVEEVLTTFGQEPHVVTVVAGCYPNGKVASLTLRQSRVYVRVRAKDFPQLRDALGFAERRNDPTRQRHRC